MRSSVPPPTSTPSSGPAQPDCAATNQPPACYFSISAPALGRQPRRQTGTVYLLPAATFDLEPTTGEIQSTQAEVDI
jgi:hypothetical protein